MSEFKVKKQLSILGLKDTSSVEELKKAFRNKAKKLHPDATGISNSESFIELKNAFEYLLLLREKSLTLPFTQIAFQIEISKKQNHPHAYVKISTKKLLLELLQKTSFKAFVISILNFILLTLLTPFELLALYLTPALLVFVLFWLIGRIKKYFLTSVIIPFFVNILLIINYTFSHSPVYESYFFIEKINVVNSYTVYNNNNTNSVIELEKNQYKNYPGIRFFFDIRELLFKNQITYTFKTGLFNLKVMTGYKLK